MTKFLGYILSFVTIIGFLLGIIAGELLENARIYNKCLEENGYMLHVEAKTKCKGIVK
jgi:hypothetical protein